MSGLSCPNCGIPIADLAVNADGVLYCCQGCADRTYCQCRVTGAVSNRPPAAAGVKR